MIHARKILSDAETAKQLAFSIGQGARGLLKIGFISSAITGILQRSVATFKAEFPDVALDIRQCVNGMAENQVSSGQFDVAIIRLPEYLHDQTEMHELTKESWVLALPEHHMLARKKRVSLNDIKALPLIFYPRYNSPTGYEQIMALFEQAGITPSIYQEAPQQMTIAALVASGMGIGIVPECMQSIRVEGLVHRPLKEGIGKTGFGCIARKINRNSLVEQFIRIAKSVAA